MTCGIFFALPRSEPLGLYFSRSYETLETKESQSPSLTTWPFSEIDRLRLLNQVVAQYLQQALQYYLRDEKGLCYAVFAQPYAQGDYEGLTCAVQSNKVGAARLLAEIKYCLADLLQRLANDWAGLKADLEALKNQLAQGDLGYEQLSVILFRHWREQRLHTGLLAEVEAQQQLSFEVFAEYCQALQDTQRWLLLSNQPRN